jgi:hypothetical protein
MPITRLLTGDNFAPEQHQLLERAFKTAIRKLGLVDRNDPICEIVARKSALTLAASDAGAAHSSRRPRLEPKHFLASIIYSRASQERGIHEHSLGGRRVPYGRDHVYHLRDRGRLFHLGGNVSEKSALLGGAQQYKGLGLREPDRRDRPSAVMTFDRNAKPVQFIEPNVLDRACLPIGKDDGFADQF